MRTLFHTCRTVALAAMTGLVALSGCGMRTSIEADADRDPGDDPFGEGGTRRACGFGPPCDPANLGGRSCESLGFTSGVVGCDPDTCSLDLSGCTGVPGDGGPVGPGAPGSPGLFGAGGTSGSGVFGAGQSGFFGAGLGDGGFFGAGNFPDGGFFGAGNDPDEDGGVDEGGGGSTGFFGSGFFGGQ
jgi:hypothetical protein